jgi:hypothetical protein
MQNFKSRTFLLIIPLFLTIPGVLYSQAPKIEWQKCLGGTSDESMQNDIESIIQTTDGGYAMAGSTASDNGDVSGNHGGRSDAWVVKLDASGVIQWQKCLGGTGEEWADCIIQTTDRGYAICGTTNSNDGDVSGNHGGLWDVWVLKLDSSGTIQWQRCLGGTVNDWGHCIIQNSDGEYVIAGITSSYSESLLNHGVDDAYIIKLNSTGNILWEKCFGGSGLEYGISIIQTHDRGYAFVGWAESHNGDVSGHHGDSTNNKSDVWFVKLDTSGTIQWQKCLGGSGDDYGSSIIESSNGGYAICSTTYSNDGDVSGNHGDADVWIVKLDNSGAIEWQKCLGGTFFDQGNSIIQTYDGGYAVIGTTHSNDGDVRGWHSNGDLTNPSADVWVVKLNSAGTLQWQKCLAGILGDYGAFII